MLWRRHHSQTEAVGKAKRRQETDEILWVGQHPPGSVHRSFKGVDEAAPIESRVQGQNFAPTTGATDQQQRPDVSSTGDGREFLGPTAMVFVQDGSPCSRHA